MLGARVDSFHDIVDPGTELSDRSMVSKTSVDVGVRAADVTDDDLAAISACLAQIAARHPDVRIHVLASSDLPSSTTALSLMSLRCVASVRTTQSREEYFRAINSLDVLLLPYREAHYRRRVSGVFFDCTSRGVTVVVAEGTTMALAYSPLVFTYYSEAMMASALDLAVGSARSSALTKLRWDVAQSVRAIAKRDVVAELTGRRQHAQRRDRRIRADRDHRAAGLGPLRQFDGVQFGKRISAVAPASSSSGCWWRSGRSRLSTPRISSMNLGREEENATRVKPHAFALMSLTRASEQRARAQ